MPTEQGVSAAKTVSSDFAIKNGSKIAVVGGGPAGSFFAYFFLGITERLGIDVSVEVFEPKEFSKVGPAGCNHCGGIVSESLVQLLSTEGINIPPEVLQRGIQSYTLHMDVGSVRIETPLEEKRIAAVFRGAGPLGSTDSQWKSFDGYLQELTKSRGATVIHDYVEKIEMDSDRPKVTTRKGNGGTYDLVVGTVGLRPSSLKLFEKAGIGYEAPKTTKTYISEFHLGHEMIEEHFGSSMHVFLLNIPRLEFAALVPKGNYVTLVMLGNKIDKELVENFMNAPEVKACFPPGWKNTEKPPCKCFPSINVKSARQPFNDRIVLIGDCATSKLYKNGIGAAYLTAKSAAATAAFYGVGKNDFKKHYWPDCKKLNFDNFLGKVIFMFTGLIQKTRFSKRGIRRLIIREQGREGPARYISSALWDTFTGSAEYTNIFLRFSNPLLFIPLVYEIAAGFFSNGVESVIKNEPEVHGQLGKIYHDNEIVVQQGDEGNCMYAIQSGFVEVLKEKGGKEIHLAYLGENDFFGEMALFEREVRSATIRAKGDTSILTIDKNKFLKRIQDDPSMAFRIAEKMSNRIREQNTQLSRIKAADRRNWDARDDKEKKAKK
ncbi:cyclic nucleotide-binding domain-containing protein [Candidatus Latescibacterota bacterium]